MSENAVSTHREVWLVGGYGDVGTRTARHLLALTNATIVLVGRDLDHAERTARSLGPRARGERLDITRPDADDRLRGASTVVSFTEALPVNLAGDLVRSGIGFVDTSADQLYTRRLRNAIASVTDPSGAFVGGAGLVPGLSNALAASVVSDAPKTERIDVVLGMGLGRRHGRDATAWTLANLAGRYTTTIDGTPTQVGTGELKRTVSFGHDHKPRPTVGFGFADQEMIATEHQLSTAHSYLTLDPAAAASLLSLIAGTAVGRFVAAHASRFARLSSLLPTFGHSGTRLAVEGFDRHGTLTRRVHMLSEHNQAELTAIMVAATTAALLDHPAPCRGVLAAHDLVDRSAAETIITQRAPNTRWIT